MDHFDPDEDERPEKPARFMGRVSAHDHVGSLVFSERKVSCECGQVWRRSQFGWQAVHHPDGSTREEVVGPSPRSRRGAKTNPNLSQVGRFTEQQESLRASMVQRWEAMGLLAPGWRIGSSSTAA